MNKFLVCLPLILLLSGCGLLPKRVEFFQRKVRAMPELSDSAKETQRQAAAFVAAKTEETKVEAITSKASTNVVQSATEANSVANALSTSLGPPSRPWSEESAKLAGKLTHQQAGYNDDLESYRNRVDKDVGKKIEGTGIVKVGYFTMWGIGIGFILLIGVGVKIYGLVNPVVGAGTSIAERVAGSVLSKGFHEIVQGGEAFKDFVQNSDLAQEAKAKVLDLFTRAHKESQSQDVQRVVSKLTS